MNISLPFLRVDLTPPYFIFAHGLGSTNLKRRTHETDKWTLMAGEAASSAQGSFLSYTARGHGMSEGWQATAASDPAAFTWERLAHDMIYKFIAGGSSMGSATALYCALQNPDRVLGLVLLRLPTAWEERKERHPHLIKSAKNLHLEYPAELHHLVLEGTAHSDLPDRNDVDTYARLKCPVLILAIEKDPVHPLSTARAVHQLIPHSKLHIARDQDAPEVFKALVASFIQELRELLDLQHTA